MERTRVVRVPDALTTQTPKPDVPARPLFGDDLERLADGYDVALDKCNADKACTRALGRAVEAGAKGDVLELLRTLAECAAEVSRATKKDPSP